MKARAIPEFAPEKRKAMKVETRFIARCCDQTQRFASEFQMLQWAVAHLKAEHPTTAKKLWKVARKIARSQNGCGYYDDGRKGSGWDQAPPEFRDAWFLQAVREALPTLTRL